jgi:hypothetical protein
MRTLELLEVEGCRVCSLFKKLPGVATTEVDEIEGSVLVKRVSEETGIGSKDAGVRFTLRSLLAAGLPAIED